MQYLRLAAGWAGYRRGHGQRQSAVVSEMTPALGALGL
jgi:hypothetical protein